LVTCGLPCFAAVVRPLDELSEPTRTLRRVQAIRIRGRSLEVVNLPTAEERTTDVPAFAFSVRRQHERALPCPYEHSYAAHHSFLPELRLALHPRRAIQRIVDRTDSRSTEAA